MSLSLHLVVEEEDLGNLVVLRLLVLVDQVVEQEDITDLPLEDQDHLVDHQQTPNHIDKDTLVVMQCQDIRHLTLVLEAAVQVVRALIPKMIR
jgi:hypothetical protein|tara:strand:- start:496 stop:774 length:279 start_codon:yes stop_codon:yes gene_type:complete